MWRKIAAVTLAGMMALSLAACDEEPAAEEILANTAEAMSGVTTLSYDMDTDLAIAVEGDFGDLDMLTGPGSTSMDVSIASSGAIDKENRQLQVDAELSYGVTGAEGSASEMSYTMAAAVYLVDDTAYLMFDIPLMGAIWQKHSLSAEEIQQLE